MRHAIGRLLTATALVSGLLAAGSPAIAAQAAPSLATHVLSTQQQARVAARNFSGMKAVPAGVGDSGQICLTSAPSYCIHANGTGNQVTITNIAADKANFTVVFYSSGLYEWQDGNGNCLREGSGDVVKIENGPCSLSDPTDAWYKTGTQISNEGDIAIMYTKGDANGDNVWADPDTPSGSWIQWNVPT